METVEPCLGGKEMLMATHQKEYEALSVEVLYDPNRHTPVMVSRWKPTDEERARIAAGEDVYLGVLTFNMALQPVIMTVGSEVWRAWVDGGLLEI